MIIIYDAFDVKITLQMCENWWTRCEKNQVSCEWQLSYIEFVPVKQNMRELSLYLMTSLHVKNNLQM